MSGSLVSRYYPSRFIRVDALPQRRGVYTIETVDEAEMRNDNGQARKQLCLGLKELESRDVVPALLAMLRDPEPQVRQVAHFALESLTGMKFKLPSRASRQDSARVSAEWHAWWREKGANFTPLHQPPCHDW